MYEEKIRISQQTSDRRNINYNQSVDMKRIAVLICAALSAVSAFAYYDDYGYSTHSDKMSGFAIFSLIVMVAYIVISIVVLVRWWKMTSDVEKIREHITHKNPKLTYLVAIGEKEQAEKAALIMVVDKLYPIYFDPYDLSKAKRMNKEIQSLLPRIQVLGISVPDYVTSGEKFIDYMNSLTGNNIPYKEGPSSEPFAVG